MKRSLLLIFTTLVLALVARAETYYQVRRVVDGDTIELEQIGKIRLIGVDTPETVHPKKPVQYFGREASNYLKTKLANKRVRVEYDQNSKDKYGRSLGYLFMEDGTFVNAQIIEQGYGHAYTRFPFKHLEKFRALERDARLKKRGLWADNPNMPSIDAAPAVKKVSAPRSALGNCAKKKCSQLSTCAEAMRLLSECGQSNLDSNGDGVPCESLCR